MEIFTDREGEIILKKYSPIGEFGMPVKLYAESLSQTMGVQCVLQIQIRLSLFREQVKKI